MRRKLVMTLAMVGLICGVFLATAQEMPKRGPQHEELAFFVGEWHFEGTVKPGPMGPGGKTSTTEKCEWFDGKFAVVCHGKGTGPMGEGKSVSINTYKPDEKMYTYHAVDSKGMPIYAKGKVEGTTWTYLMESEEEGKSVKSRVTIEETSPTSQTFTMEMSMDGGEWMTVMEGKSKKSDPT